MDLLSELFTLRQTGEKYIGERFSFATILSEYGRIG